MVAPYAATLGGLTVAIDTDRFLVEDAPSNSVLSLHPAVTFSNETKPISCGNLTGFAAHDDRVKISWEKINGLMLTTTLKVVNDPEYPQSCRYTLQLTVNNPSDDAVTIDKVHPICFQPQGPGACALGLEELRTLGALRSGEKNQLMRLQGDAIYSTHYGAWFSPMGSPVLLLATLDAQAPAVQFLFGGARGKMLSLRADVSCDHRELAPGESVELPAMLLVFGDFEINEELNLWIERVGDIRIAGTVPEFTPSDEIIDPEPEPEVEEEVLEDEPEEETSDEVKSEEEEQSVADEEEEESAVTDEEEEESNDLDDAFFEGITIWRAGRCAAYRQAMRRTRGFSETGKQTTPRWGSGRRHQPINGCSIRTRGYWRFDYVEL